MKRLLSTTAALSLALAPVQPWPLMAQTLAEDGSILADDGTVLCTPTAEVPCDIDAIMAAMKEAAAAAEAEAAAAAEAEAAAAAEAEAAAAAEAEAAAAAEAEAAAAAEAEAAVAAEAEAQKAAEDAIAAQAEAEAKAAADAEAAAAAEAQKAAEAAAQEAAAADEAAKAAADEAAKLAADEAAKAAAAADEAAKTAADEAAKLAEEEAAKTAADEAAKLAEDEAAKTAADEAAKLAEEEAAKTAVDEAAKLAEDEAAKTAADEAAKLAEDEAAKTAADEAAKLAEEEAAKTAAEEAAKAVETTDPDTTTASTDVPAPEQVPVEVPVVSAEETQSLTEILSDPGSITETNLAAAAAAAAADSTADPAKSVESDSELTVPDLPKPDVTTVTVTETDTRSSDEEFTAAPTAVGENKKSGLSDLEKVGLLALGALVVGAILKDGREVVSNSGDRVVVKEPDGRYIVYKDDDTLLRRPGATVRTETYADGSTLSTVDREDGTQVVTIRDASGRVLRRATYDSRGNEIILIDDLAREEAIDVTTLPRPRADRVTISTSDRDAALKAALARAEVEELGRTFSLRQIREIRQVRALAATIDVDNITFESGSAVIRATEARKLADLGRLMGDILDENAGEVFLIEGHTDAVGSASSNLTLSDRRAESVALALSEYFDIPPENMVVQGYGESDLRVETLSDEVLNRRVAVRVVTPLMRSADMR